MKTIHKYQLDVTTEQAIEMPAGAEILTVQNQHEGISIWAVIDDEQEKVELRHFRVYGTGHDMRSANEHKYIGTCQFQGGLLVFHVFELIPLPF